MGSQVMIGIVVFYFRLSAMGPMLLLCESTRFSLPLLVFTVLSNAQ